jgi:hypothetical protein
MSAPSGTVCAMGLLTGFKMRQQVADVQAAMSPTGYVDPSNFPIVTPWASSDLTRIVWQDIFGTEVPDNSRTAAMKLPGIARARNLLVSTISRLPLREYEAQVETDPQPPWVMATGDGSSPQLRNAWTVDDLIFYGWSCWSRSNDPETGLPVTASRINQGDWSINEDYRVEVDGQVVDADEVIVIPGLHEGLLSFGSDVLEDTRALYRVVRARVLNPIPQIDLHQTDGEEMTDEDIDALIARWAAARQGKNGGVSFTTPTIEAKPMAGGDENLLIEARNAAAVDLARLVGVHAGLIDATTPKASLNYETATGRNQEFVDFDIALYTTPITARLSLDDVTAPGRRTDFDLTDLISPTPSVSGPDLED